MICRTVAAAAALALLAGCGTEPVIAAPAAAIGPLVPSVVGLELDQADQRLQAAGFGPAGASDALRDRSPIARSDWQVCTQQPGPGPARAGTLVGVTIVQLSEACPGAATTPAAAPTPATPTTSATPTRRPHVPRLTPRPGATPTATAEPAPTGPPDDGDGTAPTVTAGTPCPTAGALGVTRWGTPVVCRAGADGRTRWRRA